jgi:hypothetical protein
MCIRNTLLGLVLVWIAAGKAHAGALHFLANHPASSLTLNVTADLAPTPPPVTPSTPSVDLSDPTHLLLTQPVQNEALFSFGMEASNGETFSFRPSGEGLTFFTATGNQGSTFDVIFNAFFTDAAGSEESMPHPA